MSYNNKNYIKRARYIISVYNAHKHADVPDTKIVRHTFPKYNIHLSYRQWMNIKGMVIPKEETQLTYSKLFSLIVNLNSVTSAKFSSELADKSSYWVVKINSLTLKPI
ncbi:hypothetical protein ACFOEQ_11100 [Chryseobacterium arachidis]|uniref:hypothetical protein n=1 Tax=Chryseobacterium arachidis TaxID=1416778 RepID=UPI003613517B